MDDRLEQVRIATLEATVDSSVDSSVDGAVEKADIDGWHAVLTACAAADEGAAAAPPWEHTAAALRTPRPGGRSLRWLAREGDAVVGTAWLRLYGGEGRRQVGHVEIRVLPDARRRGVGTALLARVQAAAEADGRRVLSSRAVAGSAGETFLAARGFAAGQELRQLRLRVAECDQDALRATVRAASQGYHLVRWPGVAPTDLIGPFAATREAMNDTPRDGLDLGRVSWDEDRVRALAEGYASRGETLLTVAAVCLDRDGHEVVAGFSEIVLSGAAGPAVARQSDTVVRKEHRGRGLGLWVKAAMLQWLLGAHPEVEQVVTTCATSNTHMIAINEQLGFRPQREERVYQLVSAP